MTWLAHLFAAVGLFISSLFGVHSIQAPPQNSNQSTPLNSTGTTTLTFEGQPTCFSKDGNHVYDNGTVLQAADSSSFVVLAYEYFPDADAYECIGKDDAQVYYDGDNTGQMILKDADALSFVDVGGLYTKDKNHVYDPSGNVLPVDLATFVSVGGGYFKDKSDYYYPTYQSLGAFSPDSQTFKIIGDDGYAADKAKVYFDGGTISGADPSTFSYLSYGYGKDARHVYLNGEVQSFDPMTFAVLDSSYVKDATKVYMNNHSDTADFIAGADAKTFVLLPTTSNAGTYSGSGDEFAKDANHVYFGLQVITGADPRTFSVVNARYGKDASHVYCMTDVVVDADPATFTGFTENVWFGKDSRHVFANGKEIPGADPMTFTLCDQSTQACTLANGTFYNAEDKNHKYDYNAVVQ